jgi:hypothetical protein
MCARLAAATDAAKNAPTAAVFQDKSRDLLEEQERFIREARALSPPEAIRGSFQDYLQALDDLVSLNHRSVEGSNDRREMLVIALDAAETGVRALEAKEAADLPDSCPPSSAAEASVFLFVARGNVAGFNLGAELEELGRFQAEADSPEETAELFHLAEGLALSLAAGLRESVPPELSDPAVERMIGLYVQRAKALEELREAFVARDRVAYDRAARRQQKAAREAEQLAQTMGLTECVGFLGIAAD